MKNLYLHITATGYVIANFYNSKEVYSTKGFETVRKANNYAKKYGYTVTEKPEGANAYMICD